MSRFKADFVTLADLYAAYRKAKAEAFLEKAHFSVLAFTRYEADLDENLRRLLQSLLTKEPTWYRDTLFLGKYQYVPKKIDIPAELAATDVHFSTLDAHTDWGNLFSRGGKRRLKASFRLVITATVDFHVISALWILKVGHLYDACLDRDCAFANKLRRIQDESGGKRVNPDSSGLFVHYIYSYREWRERGLRVMRELLLKDRRVVAVTMDVRSFYHSVNPEFLTRPTFLQRLGLQLTRDQKRFTDNLIAALATWYQSTPDYAARPAGALPVGLSASKIVSNVLLKEFDEHILTKLNPAYYGRYVDDLFLVVATEKTFSSGKEVMQWLVSQLTPMLRFTNSRSTDTRVDLPYARDSDIVFTGAKQRIFLLGGGSGLDLVSQISEQIRKQSSEYRLLPVLPDTESEMASQALLATPDASLEADALRKADAIAIRRSGLAFLLRDAEIYAKDLYPGKWRTLRERFYGLVLRHVVTPLGLFDYSSYLHRVFGLMVACGDFEFANRLLDKFLETAELLKRTTSAGTTQKAAWRACISYYVSGLEQAALQAATVRSFVFSSEFVRLVRRLRELESRASIPSSKQSLRRLAFALLKADLGRRPYKDYWFFKNPRETAQPPMPRELSVRKVLRLKPIKRFGQVSDRQFNAPYWPAIAFPTRPLTLEELTTFAPRLLEDRFRLADALFALRGSRVKPDFLGLADPKAGGHPTVLDIPDSIDGTIRVAVTNIETTLDQWKRAVRGRSDQSLDRYVALRRIVNRVLEENPRPHYLTFPECSIPRRWALGITSQLALNRVSLVAGVENWKRTGPVRNDALISLTTTWPFYRGSIRWFQPKLRPSHSEEEEIRKEGRRLFIPPSSPIALPVYKHGKHCFGLLICSDLTNVANRKHFQGHIDSLFVLEWNQDVGTFGFLVESCAHDLHAYVVQVNNRMYGDSRVRVPAAKDWQRDLVRVKGGVTDYYVLAELDITALRKYQRNSKPPKQGAFKPYPIGFEMSEIRRKNL
jgi:hypothetical protein